MKRNRTAVIFLASFNVVYTLNHLKTQIFLGTQLTDLAWFDFTQQLGVNTKSMASGFFRSVFFIAA